MTINLRLKCNLTYCPNFGGNYKQYPSEVNIQLVIEEFRSTRFNRNVDKLRLRYRINMGDLEIVNTLGLPNDHPRVIKGLAFVNNGKVYLSYYVGDSGCGQFGDVFISFWSDSEQLSFFLAPGRDTINPSETCPDEVYGQQVLPTEGIFLERQ